MQQTDPSGHVIDAALIGFQYLPCACCIESTAHKPQKYSQSQRIT